MNVKRFLSRTADVKHAAKKSFPPALTGRGLRRRLRIEQLEDRRLLASFQGLGIIAAGNFFDSSATAISANGSVVVGQTDESRYAQWTESSGWQLLNSPLTQITGVSADGSIFVGQGNDATGHADRAAIWSEAGGLVTLPLPSGFVPDLSLSAQGYGISSDGSVIVGSAISFDPFNREYQAFFWSQATGTVGLGVLQGNRGQANAVSADGSEIAGVYDNRAALWNTATPTQTTFISPINGVPLSAFANAISADGSTVVGAGQSTTASQDDAAFRWTSAQGYVPLGTLPGDTTSTATAVSGDGSVVVGTSYIPNGPSAAFIWDPSNGMRSLQNVLVSEGLGPALTGWTLTNATSISADGTVIVGNGIDPQGHFEAWIATTPELPRVVLNEATTFDAQSVTVNYAIANTAVTAPLRFDVYRSDQPYVDSTSQLLGTQIIDPSSDSQDLSVGSHAVQLLKATTLASAPLDEFIVVVADADGKVQETQDSVNTAYFRKYLLGVVSHGFELTSLPAWETDIAQDLKADDHYDDTIAFDWAFQSSLPFPFLAVRAGNSLFAQVVSTADQLAATHAGDVVDLHFIGHSRGAVVVSQALQDLLGTSDPALEGSYIKLTLLDPHPANISTIPLQSTNPIAGAVAFAIYEFFEFEDADPQVVIPANVKYSEVYYQHSAWMGFPHRNPEFVLNLWGEGPSDGIINRSGLPIHWHDLTNLVDPTKGPNGRPIGKIGHSEVPIWFQVHVVDQGAALPGSVVSKNAGVPATMQSSGMLDSSPQPSPTGVTTALLEKLPLLSWPIVVTAPTPRTATASLAVGGKSLTSEKIYLDLDG